MRLKFFIPFTILLLGVALEIALRHSSWSAENPVEAWGRLTNLGPPTSSPFTTEKRSNEVRIGIFGGLNVIAFNLPKGQTISHFLKINPPPTCELQGRKCEFRDYGRTAISAPELSRFIKNKMTEDDLDIAVWVVDPQSSLENPLSLPWTRSLAINWLLSPLTKTLLTRFLSSSNKVYPNLSAAVAELRLHIFSTQKDLIPIVIPGMDKPLEEQKDWERTTAKIFFQNGFLPLRGKFFFHITSQPPSHLHQEIGLMNEEALRAVASFARDRIDAAPRMRRLRGP